MKKAKICYGKSITSVIIKEVSCHYKIPENCYHIGRLASHPNIKFLISRLNNEFFLAGYVYESIMRDSIYLTEILNYLSWATGQPTTWFALATRLSEVHFCHTFTLLLQYKLNMCDGIKITLAKAQIKRQSRMIKVVV